MKQTLSLLLLLSLILSCLVSCGDGEQEPSVTLPPESSNDLRTVLFDGEARCHLVYPDGAGSTVLEAMERVRSAFLKLTGSELPAYTESQAPQNRSTAIYFGNTAAAWEQNIPSNAGYYSYSALVRSGNLYVYAMYEKLLTEAAIKLELQLSKQMDNGVLAIGGDFSMHGTSATYRLLSNIPYFDGADYHSTHDCDNGYEMVLLKNADAEGFHAYCEKLTAKGYTLAAENDMNGNLTRTYFNESGILLHTYLTPHSGEVRVLVADSPAYNAAPLNTSETYESFLRPLPADGGMGYLIRLGDGRFLIIDGGYNSEDCADTIYTLLKENAPDPSNIVIAAWIFTHGHIDHVGAFVKFASKYANDTTVTVQSFVEHMCLTEEQTEFINTTSWLSARSAMKNHYPTVPVYVPLTGQRLCFGNAELEILFTMPDFMPNRILNESDATPEDPLKGDGNIQSMVFRVTVNGNSILIMGDTTKVCCDEMSDRYGSYLRSKYVQMAHHGIEDTRPRAQNATKEIYGLIDPDYALLPCEADRMSAVMKKAVNQYLAELVGGTQNVICSGSQKKNIPLMAEQ